MVPDVQFRLTSGRLSSCTSINWDDHPIIAVSLLHRDGTKLTGAELLEFLLHHAAHAVGGPAASMDGGGHSEGYRDAAKSVGLEVYKRPNGWSGTHLARASPRYRAEITSLNLAVNDWSPEVTRRSGRSAVSLQCSCSEPRTISAAADTADLGPILCSLCQAQFQERST